MRSGKRSAGRAARRKSPYGRPAAAIPFFEDAIRAQPASPSECDFSDFVEREAKAAIAVCNERIAEGS